MDLDGYLVYLKDIKRYAIHTLAAYRRDIRNYYEFCEERELDPDPVVLKNLRIWVAAMMAGGAGPASVRRRISSIKGYCDFLLKNGEIESNPAEFLVLPKTERNLPSFVDDEGFSDLFEAVLKKQGAEFPELRDRVLLLTAYCTGMRRSELVALRVADVDLEGGSLKVVRGKGGKGRLLPILPELGEEMADYLRLRSLVVSGGNDAFFVTDKGRPVYDKFIYRLSVKYLSMITTSAKKGPHVIRHSFATAMLNSGACIEAIRKLLGHSSIAATQIYTHNSFENLKKVFNQAHPRA